MIRSVVSLSILLLAMVVVKGCTATLPDGCDVIALQGSSLQAALDQACSLPSSFITILCVEGGVSIFDDSMRFGSQCPGKEIIIQGFSGSDGALPILAPVYISVSIHAVTFSKLIFDLSNAHLWTPNGALYVVNHPH